MPYTQYIKVPTYQDFLDMTKNDKFLIAETIVKSILDNLTTKRKTIPIFEVEVEEEDEIYTLSMECSEFQDILKKNLQHYEKEEEYEDCIKIKNAINYLKKTKKSGKKN
jgi:protein-arginine kinase activator protein McsA